MCDVERSRCCLVMCRWKRLFLSLLPAAVCLSLFILTLSVHAQGSVIPLDVSPSWFSDDDDATQSVAWGDVDGDGDLDLAVGNGGFGAAEENRVYLNEGGALQSSADTFRTSGDADRTLSVAWGDVDGDGDLDLAVGNYNGPNKVYLNEGGVFQTSLAWTPAAADYTFGVAWGDMDGDGNLDLAVGNAIAPNHVYLNQNGSLQNTPAWTSTASHFTWVVAWGDVDGDGDLDLAAGNHGQQNKVYLNVDGALQATPVWTSTNSANTQGIAWGDVDGDGDLDLAVGNYGASNEIYVNQAGSLQATPAWVSTEISPTTSIAWGDADGDGDLDLAAGNDGNVNHVYLNDGGSLQTTAVWVSNDYATTKSVAWGDVDGDGDLDLAAGSDGKSNHVYLNQGGGLQASADPSWSPGDSDRTFELAWGDVDGDGDLDLAVGNYSQQNHVYLNENTGLQSTPVWTSTSSNNTYGVAWGDWDDDGDLDLATGNILGRNYVYLNENGVLQSTPVWTSTDSVKTYSVAWADYDGDGDLDLAAGNQEQNKVYLNEGTSLRATPVWTSTASDYTRSVAWGDVDGDGDLDLAVGNQDAQNKVYLNEGGTLQTSADWGSGDMNDTYSVAWGDVDGDGDPDLAAGNNGAENRVYLNEGGTLEIVASWTSGDADATYSVAWGDYDGDGDLDLAAGNDSGRSKVYLNEGGTLRTAASAPWVSDDPLDPTYGVAWGDVDGDGDLDLALGNETGTNKVFLSGRQGMQSLPDNAPVLDVAAPYTTARANFYASPVVLSSPTIPITYTLYDPEGDPAGWIEALYSPDGGGRWYTAMAATGTVTTPLPTGLRDDFDPIAFARWSSLSGITVTTGVCGSASGKGLNFDGAGTRSATTRVVDTRGGGTIDFALRVGDSTNPSSCEAPDTVDESIVLEYSNNGGADWSTIVSYTSGAYTDFTNVSEPIPSAAQTVSTTFRWHQAANSGSGFDNWALDNVSIRLTQVYTWDTFASGFFGQSDNVVFRMVAYPQPPQSSAPDTYHYYDGIPGPFQWPYASAATLPFRVRGTQVQVFSETVPSGVYAPNAVVYHLPKGQSDGALPLGGVDAPFRTDHNGYLQGRGQLAISDTLFAMLPVHSALNYAGALSFDGLDDWIETAAFDLDNDFTLSLWVNPQTTADGQAFLAKHDAGGADQILLGFYDGGYHLRIRGDTATGGALDKTTGWQHLAVVGEQNGGLTSVTFYKDGQVLWQDDVNALVGDLSGRPWVIGQDWDSDVLSDFFGGSIDQVIIWNVARTQEEVQADMVRPIAGDESGLVAYWTFDDPGNADAATCHDQTPNGYHGALHGPSWVGESLGGYTIYHTSGVPNRDGLDAFTVAQPGVQKLAVSAQYPLVLFDLNLSLEWDARNDSPFLDRLESDLRRASELLYDWTNGQAALGTVTVFHDKAHWTDAQVQVYASNHLRPNADQGGLVTDVRDDPDVLDVEYVPGHVRIGATWNRYGESSGSLGEDWPRTLAHELGHYAFFLDDNYLGLDTEGTLVSVYTCPGAMTDPYRDDASAGYGEFHPDPDWTADCADTLSHQLTSRSDWATMARFYGALVTPTVAITDAAMQGPHILPLAVTQILDDPYPPPDPSQALDVPIFFLTSGGERYAQGARARAFLFQDQRLTDLGGPTTDQVLARGARPNSGDVVCVYDVAHAYQGCQVVGTTAGEIEMRHLPDWLPDVRLSEITTETIQVSVQVTAAAPLKARFFRVEDLASDVISLTFSAGQYVGTFSFLSETLPLEGYILVWEDADDDDHADTAEAQVLTDYSIGGNPGLMWSRGGLMWSRGGLMWSRGGLMWSRGGLMWSRGGLMWSRGGLMWSRGAPGMSADGRAIVFGQGITFDEGQLFALQSVTHLPDAPPWATAIGQGYRLVLSDDATGKLDGASIGIHYLGSQVPEGEEAWLRMYHWNEATGQWDKLPTELDPYHNTATAQIVEAGLYALMSSIEIPLDTVGWNLVAYPVLGTRPVTEALLSIQGCYSIVYGYDGTNATDPWKVRGIGVDGYVNDLHEMEFGRGYWISATEVVTWHLKGSAGQMSSASTIHSPPATYYGPVQAGKRFTPTVGMPVYAYVNGHQCGRGETLLAGGEIVYSINVFADGPGGAAGCGRPGEEVTFYVGGQLMKPVGMWNDSQLWELRLSPDEERRIYLPLVLKNR